MNALFYFLIALVSLSCAGAAGKVVTPVSERPLPHWTEEGGKDGVEIKLLRKTENASFHLIHLIGAEKPHVHETHDLTVFVLEGRATVHLGDKIFEAFQGDVLEIPRGTPHWAVNESPSGSTAYAIFTPPLAGKDFKEVEPVEPEPIEAHEEPGEFAEPATP